MGIQETGQRGESIAGNYLQQRGWTILNTNWRCAYGEIDLVARHESGQIAFVEVRTRNSNEAALESITPKKQKRMTKSAYAYLNAHDLPEETAWRIDVIAVTFHGEQAEISHVEDALGW